MVTKATHDRTLEAPDRPAFGPGGMTPRKGRPRASLALVLSVMLLATALSAGPAGTAPAATTSPVATSTTSTASTPEPLPEDDLLRFPDDHPYFPGQIITGDEDPELALAKAGGGQWSSSSGLNVYSTQITSPELLDAVEHGLCPERQTDPDFDCEDGRPEVLRWFVEIDRYIGTDPFGGNLCELVVGDSTYQAAFDVLAANGVKVDVQFWTSAWTIPIMCSFSAGGARFDSQGLDFYRDVTRHFYDLLRGSYGQSFTDLVSFGAWNEPDFFQSPYNGCDVVPRNPITWLGGKWSGGSDLATGALWANMHSVFDDHLGPDGQPVPIPAFNNSAAASTYWTRDWVNSNGSSCSTSTSLFDADGVNHWVGDSLRNERVSYLDLHRYFTAEPTAKRLAEYTIELLQLYDAKALEIDPVDPRMLPVFIGELGINANSVWSAPYGTNEYCSITVDPQPVDADDARELRKLHYFLSNYLGDRYLGTAWHGGRPEVTLGQEHSIWDPDYSTEYDLQRCPRADLLVDGDDSDSVTVEQGIPVNLAIDGEGTLSAGAQEVRWWLPGNDNYVVGDTTTFTFDQPGTYELAVQAFDNSGPINPQNDSSAAWDFDRTTVHVLPFEARVTADPISGDAPLTVSFDASSSTGDIAEYRWDFDGDGSTDLTTSDPTADHVYETAGSYQASLNVADDQGRESAPATVWIQVTSTAADHVKVAYSNQLNYTNDNDVTTGDVTVSTSSVSGSVTVPSATGQPGETAAITFALRKKTFLWTTYWSGSVYVNDAPAGFAITTTFPLGKQLYVDGQTASASLYGLVDTRSLPWRSYNFTMEVTDNA
ncbi:MAG: hypothetical protein JJLCMIEE_02104 [Acidimicrobiales bacterium]|nr:hypothetical protein [Acidimicrobiales bacterium]